VIYLNIAHGFPNVLGKGGSPTPELWNVVVRQQMCQNDRHFLAVREAENDWEDHKAVPASDREFCRKYLPPPGR
jgi:hypothetical protein